MSLDACGRISVGATPGTPRFEKVASVITEKGNRMKEKLIKLVCACPCDGPENVAGCCPSRKHGMCGEVERVSYCAIQKIAEHLIANGVTITPAVPEPKMDHDMAEICYRNGQEAMRGQVIGYLQAMEADGLEIAGDIVKVVQDLK